MDVIRQSLDFLLSINFILSVFIFVILTAKSVINLFLLFLLMPY